MVSHGISMDHIHNLYKMRCYIQEIMRVLERINLSDYSEKCIKKLHKLIHTETEYEEKDWIESIASNALY